MTTIQQWLTAARSQLQLISSSPELDAEWLLAEVLQRPRAYLYAHSEQLLTERQSVRCDELLRRRGGGEPLAYLAGHKEFWSLDLLVSPATLIPRPETELLVEAALSRLPQSQSMHVADLGTGSGAIALALAKERPVWQLYATDTSVDALAVAQTNAKRLHLHNVIFCPGEWCSALPPGSRFAAIISNPPYLAAQDPHLDQGDVRFEPRSALVGGEDGLAAFRRIIQQTPGYLVENGWLILEHGYDQRQQLQHLLRQHGFSAIQGHQDLAGIERMIAARYCGKI